ncbi:hypothetical protein HU200_062032 [Digitaria exilis]|uniref:Secreted protein n=1 Tax=Digitaria exilis TaxID=1010633 RepID=A0A835ADZ9_9POAL|nr:hypothetical protein HU200_062032 [Digitaria exilis]CAB3481631.1 unnamed protein product [Digitaria exilis]
MNPCMGIALIAIPAAAAACCCCRTASPSSARSAACASMARIEETRRIGGIALAIARSLARLPASSPA